GESSARERFANELGVIDGFREDMAKQTAELIGKSMTAIGLTGPERERLKALLELQQDITKQEQKDRDDNIKRALTEYASFETKRVRLRKDAEEDMKVLDEQGRRLRKKKLEEDTRELYKAQLEDNEDFKNLMKTVDTAGSSVALTALRRGRDVVKNFIKGLKPTTAEEKAAVAELEKLSLESLDSMTAA